MPCPAPAVRRPFVSFAVLVLVVLAVPASAAAAAGAEPGEVRFIVDIDPTNQPLQPEECAPVFCRAAAAGSWPQGLRGHEGRVFFSAFDPEHGRELWTSDGTEAGTRRVADLTPGPGGTWLWLLDSLGGRLVFAASRDSGRLGLWSTDGTAERTRALSDAWTVSVSVYDRVSGGRLYFATIDSTHQQRDLHSTDGTVEGTRFEARLCDGTDCRQILAAGHGPGGAPGVYYVDRLETGVGLWWKPASGSAPVRLPEMPGRSADDVLALFPLLDGVALLVRAGGGREELWFAQPGGRVERLVAGVIHRPVRVADRLFFQKGLRFEPSDPFGVWISDGTAAGTREVLRPDSATSTWLHPFRGQLYVFGGACEGGHEVRVIDPTTERSTSSCWPGPVPYGVGSGPGGDVLLYADPQDAEGSISELWASDGTAEGTHRILRLETPPESLSQGVWPISGFAEVGGRLFLSAETDDRGFELHEVMGRPLADPRLHVQDGRYRIRVRWKDHHGSLEEGEGYAVPVTGASGFFWFFRRENLELVAKVLDGSPVNGHDWVFYGGITDLEYELEVTDVLTGDTRTYHHAPGDLCGGADTLAFPHPRAEPASLSAPGTPASTSGSGASTPSPASAAGSRAGSGAPSAATTAAGGPAGASSIAYGACPADALCVGADGRFAARVRWKNQYGGGAEGVGHPVPATDRSGWFWFFRPHNLEVMVKVLDGTPVNGHHWVLTGGLTTVEHWLEVTDRSTGAVRTYHHPAESTCGLADTAAFLGS